MKQFPRTELMSVVSVIFGVVGLVLQSWLCGSTDAYGLLNPNHFATILSYILLLVVAAGNLLILGDVRTSEDYDHLFPKSLVAAVGSFMGAAGILMSTFTFQATGVLYLLTTATGILSAVALGYAGCCRLLGKRPYCLVFGVVVVFLIFRTLLSCRAWSVNVQVQTFLFPLLANFSLLLAAYYRTALGAGLKNCQQYMFFRQMAVFCCLLGGVWYDLAFYMAGAAWLLTDFCQPDYYGKYAA